MKNRIDLNNATIPIYFPARLVRWLEIQGYDRSQLIEGAGLTNTDIDVPETLVSYKQHQTLINNALAITNNPHLGLYFGLQLKLTAMGLASYAMDSSDELSQGIYTIIQYMAFRVPLIKVSMQEHKTRTHMIYKEAQNYGEQRLFMYETLLTSSLCLFEIMGLAPEHKTVIHLPISEPEDWCSHKDLVACPVRFNQDKFEIVFLSCHFKQTLKLAGPVRLAWARKICARHMNKLEEREGLIGRINEIVSKNIIYRPPLAEVAQRLCISSRTLRRELKNLGTSYQALLDEKRKDVTIRLLKTSNISTQEVARKMGYSDSANFTRAFRRWTGKLPSHYRSAIHSNCMGR